MLAPFYEIWARGNIAVNQKKSQFYSQLPAGIIILQRLIITIASLRRLTY